MSAEAVLTPAAERFLTRHVDSVDALGLLLLLQKERGRDWAVAELCAQLQCPSAWAVRQLGRFAMLNLVIQPEPGRHRYSGGGRYGTAVDEIALACRQGHRAVLFRTVSGPRPRGTAAD